MIRNEKGKPVGRDHIAGIEGFWSYAKSWPAGTAGAPLIPALVLGEVCYRYNHRARRLASFAG